MSRHTRRTFLKRTTAAGLAASFAIGGTRTTGQIIGPTIRSASGGRGQRPWRRISTPSPGWTTSRSPT